MKPGQGESGSISHYCSAVRHKWGVMGDGPQVAWKMGDWRGTKADPIVPGGPLGKDTSLCPRHTDVHPAGAQAGA